MDSIPKLTRIRVVEEESEYKIFVLGLYTDILEIQYTGLKYIRKKLKDHLAKIISINSCIITRFEDKYRIHS